MAGGPDELTAAAERALMDGLFSPAGRDDPHSVLRATDIPGRRYAFVRTVLHDPRFVAPIVADSPDLMFQLLARFLPRLPPERHQVVRSRFSGLFTARRVERYRVRITATTEQLLDVMAAGSRADLVADFSRPLPFSIISDVLGVPAERQAWLADTLAALGRGFAGQRSRGPVERGNAAAADLVAYFSGALDERVVEPREDLLSLLAAEPVSADVRLDLIANCIFFVLAGHATTTTMLSAGAQLLADNRDQLDRLRQDPGGWPGAVEEILRYVSPITLTGATAQADVVVDGCPVSAGEQRTVVYAGANRDPGVFADPDRFDVARTPNPHLAFSAGATFCLGAPLARLHGLIALPALFDRFPDLRPDGPPTWRGSVPVRQIEAMPVRW